MKRGGDSWFFLTVDYALGHALERDTAEAVKESGGKVVGSVKHPLNTSDFSSYVLQAQQSKAKVVAFANAGGDLINSIKEAQGFGLFEAGQKPVGVMVFLTDVHSLGLDSAQGLQLAASFYWDMNDEARAWSKRFFEKVKRMPTMPQAGVYTAVLHYLSAVKAAGTDEPLAVAKKMREMPINDFMTKNGRIREDGRVLRDFYLFEVKKPSESEGAVGLLQTRGDRAGRASGPAAVGERLSARQQAITRGLPRTAPCSDRAATGSAKSAARLPDAKDGRAFAQGGDAARSSSRPIPHA